MSTDDQPLDPSLVDDELGYDEDASAWDDDEVIEVEDLDGDAAVPDLGDLTDEDVFDPAAFAALGFDLEDIVVLRRRRGRAPARRGDRRTAQRGQVHPRQPHPRPPRGGRRGRARASPATA